VFFAKGIAQAKNGDKFFWKEKIHAANGKAQKHALKVPYFFSFQVLGQGEGFFFFFFFIFPWFPSGSHSVPQVPNEFPNKFSIAPDFSPICFGKCYPPFTYIAGPKERNTILQNKTFYFGELP
jgi:hypothetical protein